MPNSNKIFVSPGVYTSEKDLTYVAQSVGVTTLGLAGETLKGPAFEPLLITNFDEFKTYFGSTSPEKDGNGNPKYELGYVAKAYLQESNQLFVTRILGLTGYKPRTSFCIKTSDDSVYSGMSVVVLRSRGSYSGETLNLEVTGCTEIEISGTGLTTNPLAEFVLSVTGATSGPKTYTCSLDTTSSKYITKVLGTDVFDKNFTEYPLYVHEVYPTLVKTLYEKQLITGLTEGIVCHTVGDDFKTDWDTPASPWVVSEVRGGSVADLFKVQTISDGNAANYQVKVTIMNVDLDQLEFDVVVRDYNDTDENMVVLEKFTRCTMDSKLPGYVALKIGTSDGEYELRSKFIMLVMASDHPEDAIPCGFKGFLTDTLTGTTLGGVQYKTKYFDAGDETGRYEYIDSAWEPVLANATDKPRKVSLGLSSAEGFDNDIFKFKGVGTTTELPTALLPGFHMSVNASGITESKTITGFMYETTPYDLEGADKGKLDNIAYRKFTFAVCGGFDGWDIYRSVRTNTDEYVFGKKTYVLGEAEVFSDTVGNSDYYAYLTGIETFANPEAIDINVFATPGLDFYNHNSLVTLTIDMIENDRADSLYIINSANRSVIDDIISDIENTSLDSNYSATYWPWIQIRDTDNSTQLYIPPTAEVVRNIALTDNVSYPWFAVAGYSRGLVKSVKAFKKLTLDERDILYKNRINPIATFSDTGTIIWGNKTLQVRESALDRINVRRLLLRARKLISAVAVRLLFEQNDEQVRNDFTRMVNPILESIKKERGLYDFRVTVSNDPEDYDANTLRGKIFIKPTRSLEFIDIEFIITPTGASFENV